jgi:hypothetical protein
MPTGFEMEMYAGVQTMAAEAEHQTAILDRQQKVAEYDLLRTRIGEGMNPAQGVQARIRALHNELWPDPEGT